MTVCRYYRRVLERFFTQLSQIILFKPHHIILLALLVVAGCTVGLFQWQVERRTEKLLTPQNSESARDLNEADRYFRLKVREEKVILVAPEKENVLTPRCFREALEIHREVVRLDSYEDLCSTSAGGEAESDHPCLLLNPLELFGFRNHSFSNLTQTLDAAYNDPTLLMRNGRPLIYNFPKLFGGVSKSSSGQVTRAQAIQMTYFMRDTENHNVAEWEKSFVEKLASLGESLSCGKIRYSTGSSRDQALSDSIKSGVLYVLVGSLVTISFVCGMMCKMGSPLTSHSLLAFAGVSAILLGNLAGFGLATFIGTPFIEMAGIIPVFVLSVGINDMLIVTRKLDEYRCHSLEDIMKVVTCHSGIFVTMTTLIDVVTLAVMTTTQFPGIKYFCVYAACSVTLAYVMMVTFFLAFAVYDIRRRSVSRDSSPCCHASRSDDGAPACGEFQTSKKLLALWGRFLMLPPTKIGVILLSVGFLGLGIYGIDSVHSIDKRTGQNIQLAKHDSHFAEFVEVQNEYFDRPIEVSIVVSGRLHYESKNTQMDLAKLTEVVTKNQHYQNHTISWFAVFAKFTEKKNLSIDSQRNFTSSLKAFLEVPLFSVFKEDVKFSPDQGHVAASRIVAFMNPSNESAFKRDAMLTLRRDLVGLPAFPISRSFISFEQYVVVPKELARIAVITLVAISVAAFPLMISFSVVVLVCLGFAVFMMELLGLTYVWGVPIDALFIVNLAMAIVLYVEYSVHIAHAFMTSPQRNINDRVVNALETMGPNLFKGGKVETDTNIMAGRLVKVDDWTTWKQKWLTFRANLNVVGGGKGLTIDTQSLWIFLLVVLKYPNYWYPTIIFMLCSSQSNSNGGKQCTSHHIPTTYQPHTDQTNLFAVTRTHIVAHTWDSFSEVCY